MIRFEAVIEKFNQQGEKTGWTYIRIPAVLASKLNKEDHKSFRVKGSLDQHPVSGLSLLPMGEGNYILALNAMIRKKIKKQQGAKIAVVLEKDLAEIKPPAELMECLADEPKAMEGFNKLTKGHRNYYINWINSAKTIATKSKRIAACIQALERGWNFGQMMRAMKKDSLL